MCSPHRRALRRLRAALGVRLAVRRDGGLWRVYEGLALRDHHQVAGRVIARAASRMGALELASQSGRAR